MGTLKHKKVEMQVARSLTLFIFVISMACSKNEHLKNTHEGETFTISKGATKDASSIIVGQCFDWESKSNLLPTVLNINGVVLLTKNGLFNYHVWPGNYDIRVGFIGKRWTSTIVKIEKGDSVNIKFYLKDDDTPLYENK